MNGTQETLNKEGVTPTGFNQDSISIATGYIDAGAWHRAIDIARHLKAAGIWDGAQLLTIYDAYAAHGKMALYDQPLVRGVDYELPDSPHLCRVPDCNQPLKLMPQPSLTPSGAPLVYVECVNPACPMVGQTLILDDYATVDLAMYGAPGTAIGGGDPDSPIDMNDGGTEPLLMTIEEKMLIAAWRQNDLHGFMAALKEIRDKAEPEAPAAEAEDAGPTKDDIRAARNADALNSTEVLALAVMAELARGSLLSRSIIDDDGGSGLHWLYTSIERGIREGLPFADMHELKCAHEGKPQ